MRPCHDALSPTRINNAKTKARNYKLSDGVGLFVEISPSGLKIWRYQYRLGGQRKTVTIGKYPEIGVADARDRHFDCRLLVERGTDPAEIRRRPLIERKVQIQRDQRKEGAFEAFSRRWLVERMGSKASTYRSQMESLLERFIWPEIGAISLVEVKPVHVLRIIEARRSTPNTAERVRMLIQLVFNYAIQKLKTETNPALPLRGMIEVPRAVHHRHLEEHELGKFWCTLEKQGAYFVTIAAAKLLCYSMLRKSEVLQAKCNEFDLERGIWDIPADRMKMRSSHRVYLSRQAKELLELLWAMDARREHVFPSVVQALILAKRR